MHDQGAASGGLEFRSLLHANFAAVAQSIPVISLAFVYQVIVVLTEFFSGESLLFASLRSLPHHCCDV
jgi:hypothetical protein